MKPEIANVIRVWWDRTSDATLWPMILSDPVHKTGAINELAHLIEERLRELDQEDPRFS